MKTHHAQVPARHRALPGRSSGHQRHPARPGRRQADAHTLGASAFVQFATLDEVHEMTVAGRVSEDTVQPLYDRGVLVVHSAPDSVAGPPVPIMEESSS